MGTPAEFISPWTGLAGKSSHVAHFFLFCCFAILLHSTRVGKSIKKMQCYMWVLQPCENLDMRVFTLCSLRPLWMLHVLLLCHYHQSSMCTSSLMKHIDICYFDFHINAPFIPWALTLWLRESAHIFFMNVNERETKPQDFMWLWKA